MGSFNLQEGQRASQSQDVMWGSVVLILATWSSARTEAPVWTLDPLCSKTSTLEQAPVWVNLCEWMTDKHYYPFLFGLLLQLSMCVWMERCSLLWESVVLRCRTHPTALLRSRLHLCAPSWWIHMPVPPRLCWTLLPARLDNNQSDLQRAARGSKEGCRETLCKKDNNKKKVVKM